MKHLSPRKCPLCILMALSSLLWFGFLVIDGLENPRPILIRTIAEFPKSAFALLLCFFLAIARGDLVLIAVCASIHNDPRRPGLARQRHGANRESKPDAPLDDPF